MSNNHNVPRMTEKMRLFAEEYVTGQHTGKRFNATAAAGYAGYSVHPNNPSNVAVKIKAHPLVQAYINELMDEHTMSALEVLTRFTEIARVEAGDIVDTDIHGNLRINPIKVLQNKKFIKQFGFDSNGNPKVEFHDAYQALKDIARVRGMLKDSMEVSGPGGGAVAVAMQVQFVNPDGSKATDIGNTSEEDWSDVEEE
jgi:hypothetical protein